ncbi:hypothetical protein AMTR_s00092p00052470 [Amborella trichopoda]|uniref:Pentacotripeptide-repeat region of PRORP domain-containing protein n=1 Tax=Amborella trichopoda TaxID=13333 RepID=W1NUC0_AMBTC|nr:hypothetical protein AMTR_s00092p00052470 [Amborella trichopoda]
MAPKPYSLHLSRQILTCKPVNLVAYAPIPQCKPNEHIKALTLAHYSSLVTIPKSKSKLNITITNLFAHSKPITNLAPHLKPNKPITNLAPQSKPKKPITNLSPQPKLKQHITNLVPFNSLITKYGRRGLVADAEALFDCMSAKDVVTWTSLLTAYANNGLVDKARKTFDEMPQKGLPSWNAMLTCYVKNNLALEAYNLFTQMPCRNEISWTIVITGFAHAGYLSEAERIYERMPGGKNLRASNALLSGYVKCGEFGSMVRIFDEMTERDVVSWTTLLEGMWRAGRVEEAIRVFNKMPERNVVSWTSMVSGYSRKCMWVDAMDSFIRMRRDDGVVVNSTALTVAMDACACHGKLREGVQLHGLVVIMGFQFDLILGNAVITMYGKNGAMDDAHRIFMLMDEKCLVSWNAMVTNYAKIGQMDEAMRLFGEMPKRDLVSWTSLIAGFSNTSKIAQALKLFREMPEKDVVAWTAMISGFLHNGEFENAIEWFMKMIREGIIPNSQTFSSVLSASAGLASLNQGQQIHAQAVKMEARRSPYETISIENSLISMYSKCGNVDEAYRVFERIGEPNLVTWNSMIVGFAQHGRGAEALDQFERMELEGERPNHITLLGVLSAFCVLN